MAELQQQLAEAQRQVTDAKDETARMVGMLEAGLDQLQVCQRSQHSHLLRMRVQRVSRPCLAGRGHATSVLCRCRPLPVRLVSSMWMPAQVIACPG